MRRGLTGPVVVVLALAVALGSCGSGDDESRGGDQGDDRSAAEAQADLDTAVREAYAAVEQARMASAAAPSPDPELPALAQTHTGAALNEWVRVTTRLQTLGMGLRYPAGSQRSVDVMAVRPDGDERAVLDVCTVSDGEVVLVTGDQVVSGGLRTVRTTETMTRVDGTWRLAERAVVSIEPGATCG